MGQDCCKYTCPTEDVVATSLDATFDASSPNFIAPGFKCPNKDTSGIGKAPRHYWFFNDPATNKLNLENICVGRGVSVYNANYVATCPCNGEWNMNTIIDKSSGATCFLESAKDNKLKGSSCNYDCGGVLLCPKKSDKTCSKKGDMYKGGGTNCQYGGSPAYCKRDRYLGDPSTCCLLAAADKQSWPGTNNRLQDSTISGIPPLGWSDDYMNGSNYSCDPSTKDYSNSQGGSICPSAVAARCSAQDSDTRNEWNPDTGLCFNYINSTRNLNTIQTPALVLKTTVDALNSKFPGSSVLASSDADVQSYTNNLLQACGSVPGACDSGLNTMCGIYTRQDIIDAYDRYVSTSDTQSKNIYTACGCHLPSNQYSNWAGDIDQTCDPLCQLSGAIPRGSTLGQKDQCAQNVCIMDKISVDVINSNIGDGVNFNMVCPGCSGGTCSCIFSEDTVNVLNSNIGKGINFSADCNTCAIQPNINSPAQTPIQCPNGTGSGGSSSGTTSPGTSKKWYEKHRDLLIGVIIGIIILMFVVIIALSRGSSSSSSEGGDIQNYFDDYSF